MADTFHIGDRVQVLPLPQIQEQFRCALGTVTSELVMFMGCMGNWVTLDGIPDHPAAQLPGSRDGWFAEGGFLRKLPPPERDGLPADIRAYFEPGHPLDLIPPRERVLVKDPLRELLK